MKTTEKNDGQEVITDECGHLVLSRKITQTIRIGDNVTVCIEEVQKGRVKVGITAPRSIKILRGELEPTPRAAA